MARVEAGDSENWFVHQKHEDFIGDWLTFTDIFVSFQVPSLMFLDQVSYKLDVFWTFSNLSLFKNYFRLH